MAKVITAGAVNILHPESGDLVTLLAGDRVPDWADALITNPTLIGDAPTDTDDVSSQTTDTSDVSSQATNTVATVTSEIVAVDGTVTELRAQAKALGIAQGGSKADLIGRITAKLAENPVGIAADSAVGDTAVAAGTGESESDHAALVARAAELGIEADEELTDEELEALIENAED